VLPEEFLRKIQNNPFAILRSGVFRDSEDDVDTDLEELSPLSATATVSMTKILSAAPREIVEQIVRALTVQTAERRSLILLTGGGADEAILSIESAFLLLPPDFRSQIRFSTNEPDPYARLGRGSDGIA